MEQVTTNQNRFHRPLTPVLVFAVAGRIGSGASFVKDGLVEELKAFGYQPIQIDVTAQFLEREYNAVFQNQGTLLRACSIWVRRPSFSVVGGSSTDTGSWLPLPSVA